MAAEKFHVIFDTKHAGIAFPGVGDGAKTFSKTEAEELAGGNLEPNVKYERYGKEPITILGPIQQAKILTVECELTSGAASVAKLVKYVLGGAVAGVIPAGAGKTKATEGSITQKEEGEKPMGVVKTTAIAPTGAV